MEKEFRKITLTFGVIMAVLGALVIWRGVTKMIPVTGWVHGDCSPWELVLLPGGGGAAGGPALAGPAEEKERGGAGKSVMKQVTIYTDGACSGNPGPGGWGAVLLYGSHRKEISGGRPPPPTTAWSSRR